MWLWEAVPRDGCPPIRSNRWFRVRRFRWLALVLLLFAWPAKSADWRDKLAPTEPGNFPPLPPVDLTFTFGWSDVLEAAQATAEVRRSGGTYRAKVRGATVGFARLLWPLDASHTASIDAKSLRPLSVSQLEKYRSRKIETELRFDANGLKRWRKVSPSKAQARWKRIEFMPIHDLLGAVLFVRSQPLKTGDGIRLVAFPGDSPYLATLRVEGRESISVQGTQRDAIRLALEIQKLEVEDKVPVRPVKYAKFRSGRFWISDDELRLPLRAEVNVFVGFVYGELTGFSLK